MPIFEKYYLGFGAFRVIADFMTTVGRMLDNIKVYGGYVRVTPSGISIYIEDRGPWFTGTAYTPNGEKVTGLDSDSAKLFVKYRASTNSFSQETGPMPEPWGSGDVWFVKGSTAGDIVVTRLG